LAQISINGPATEAEAAAVSAAIERFLGDTVVAPAPVEKGMNPWLRAALVDGVSAKEDFGPGDPRELS
jgi:hypothetical protein